MHYSIITGRTFVLHSDEAAVAVGYTCVILVTRSEGTLATDAANAAFVAPE